MLKATYRVVRRIRETVPGAVFVFVMIPLALLSVVSSSFAIDAAVAMPSWASIAIAMAIALCLPPLHIVLAVAGIFFWP